MLGNDFVRAASAPSVEFIPPPGFGLTNTGGGGFTFASPTAFVGTVQFDYVVHSDDGNSNTGHISVAVTDATAPVLSLPANITVYATGSSTTVGYNASATDAIDGPRPVSCAPQPNTNFPIGLTTVQCSSTDTQGNLATGSFTVTVLARILTSIEVSPSSASMTVGNGPFYQATGHYNDGSTQPLTSNSNLGNGPPMWSGHLSPGMNINMCATAEYPPSSVIGGIYRSSASWRICPPGAS